MTEPRMEVIVHDVPTTVEVAEDSTRFEVIVSAPQTEVSVDDPRVEVIVHETRVEVVDERPQFEVIVSETQIEVVSVGIQGPPGPQGLQGPTGPSGGIDQASAPLTFVNGSLFLAPGSTNGDGLIWNGTAWVSKPVVPSGLGTIPYTTAQGFGGDNAHLRWDTGEQALHVTRINNSSLDGGNF
jgi:hypothetical protein